MKRLELLALKCLVALFATVLGFQVAIIIALAITGKLTI